MSDNQTRQRHSELLHTQLNAGEDQNKEKSTSEQLIVREAIIGTPFHYVESELGCGIVLGKYRLTSWMDKEQFNLEAHIRETNWELLFNMVVGMMNALEEKYEDRLKEITDSIKK